jgi:DNA repair exonuclease SbcCD ATPase subunit
MSGLAQVFVVLTLVLSLLFFGTSATLFLTRQNLKEELDSVSKKYEAVEKTLNGAINSQKGALTRAHSALDIVRNSESQLSVAKHSLLSANTLEKTRAEKAESSRDTAVKNATAVHNELAKKEERIQALEQHAADATQRRDEALASAKNANEERNRARRDLSQVNKELHELKVESVDLLSKYEAQELRLNALIARLGPDAPVPGRVQSAIDARVDAVDLELSAVVLSVGRDQDVKVGDEFTVHRGEEFVGKVKVTRLFRDLSGARVVFEKDGAKIRVGDQATTRL